MADLGQEVFGLEVVDVTLDQPPVDDLVLVTDSRLTMINGLGMTLDWQGDFMRQGFTFVNPNASKTCSCGQSFFA